MRRRLRLVPLVASWYCLSVVAVATAKAVLDETAAPASLCAVQLFTAVCLSRLALAVRARRRARLAESPPAVVRGIAASYALGFLLTNAAFALAAAAFVETFKAAEPLSTVLLRATHGAHPRRAPSQRSRSPRSSSGSHTVHTLAVHLPLGALLSPCTVCGTGPPRRTAPRRARVRTLVRLARADRARRRARVVHLARGRLLGARCGSDPHTRSIIGM